MLSLWIYIFIQLSSCSTIREYHFETTARTWNDSKIFCETYYDGLATILTEEDLNSAVYTIPYLIGHLITQVWIGLNDIDTEGDWKWIDGTPCSVNTSTGHHCSDLWGKNEPNNWWDGEDCGGMWYIDSWVLNDMTCDNELPFLCNIPFEYEYIFNSTFMNWSDAETYCNRYHDGMATILSSNDYTNAIKAIPKGSDSAWIGMNDLKEEGVWEWSNGDKCVIPNNVSHDCSGFWAPQQPDNGKGENCGEIWYFQQYKDWFMNDWKCDWAQSVLCIRQSNIAHSTRHPEPDVLYKHFALSLVQRTWGDALIYCEQHYDGMAAILSEEDLESVTHVVPNNVDVINVHYIWIGINDLEHEGVWIWVNGEPCTLNNDNCTDLWNTGEPNDWGDGEEDCGELRYYSNDGEFKMNDVDCQSVYPVLCYNNISTVKSTLYPTQKPVTSTKPTSLKVATTVIKASDDINDKHDTSSSSMSAFDIILLLIISILVIALSSTIFCLVKFKRMNKRVEEMTDYVRDQKKIQLVTEDDGGMDTNFN